MWMAIRGGLLLGADKAVISVYYTEEIDNYFQSNYNCSTTTLP